MKRTNVTLAIQAGGASSRMGQDKGLLPFLGKPLVQRIIERGSQLTDDILITTNQREAYQFLNIPLYSDLLQGRGSIIGLHTALSVASREIVAVVACDMPFVNIPLLAYQVDVLQEQGADVVIPRVEHGLEPLHCVYRRETCLPVVEQTFRSGKMALVSWLNKVNTVELSKEQIEHYDPQFRAFINVNTPQEFSQAEGLADESA